MSDLNGPVWRDGAFHADPWRRFESGAEIPGEGEPLLAPLAIFLAEAERFSGYNGPLGVEVSPGESVTSLAPHLARLSLIALSFPKFSDGRNYSAARLLRERLGYRGEMRAVGEVLHDQIPLMRRCGFDSYEVRHQPTRTALARGSLAEVRRFYQPVSDAAEVPAGTRPWLRQPAG